MASDPPPPELVEQLEQTVGTPPPINDPATDLKKAMEFHLQNNTNWMLTMKSWYEPK